MADPVLIWIRLNIVRRQRDTINPRTRPVASHSSFCVGAVSVAAVAHRSQCPGTISVRTFSQERCPRILQRTRLACSQSRRDQAAARRTDPVGCGVSEILCMGESVRQRTSTSTRSCTRRSSPRCVLKLQTSSLRAKQERIAALSRKYSRPRLFPISWHAPVLRDDA